MRSTTATWTTTSTSIITSTAAAASRLEMLKSWKSRKDVILRTIRQAGPPASTPPISTATTFLHHHQQPQQRPDQLRQGSDFATATARHRTVPARAALRLPSTSLACRIPSVLQLHLLCEACPVQIRATGASTPVRNRSRFNSITIITGAAVLEGQLTRRTHFLIRKLRRDLHRRPGQAPELRSFKIFPGQSELWRHQSVAIARWRTWTAARHRRHTFRSPWCKEASADKI